MNDMGFRVLKDVKNVKIIVNHGDVNSRGDLKLAYDHAGTPMMLNLNKKVAEVLIANGMPYE